MAMKIHRRGLSSANISASKDSETGCGRKRHSRSTSWRKAFFRISRKPKGRTTNTHTPVFVWYNSLMGLLFDLSGKTFHYLTVLKRLPRSRPGDSSWLCRCICGNELRVQSSRLRADRIKSCGCKRRELVAAGNLTHGHWVGNKPSPEVMSWRSAINRCHNPAHRSYSRYGERGIAVCDEWRNDFAAFLKHMGPRPVGSTLDRIDTGRGYEPGNCRWSTPKEQSNNMRNNRFVVVRGERLTIRVASDRYGLDYRKFRNALYRHGQFNSESGDLFTLLGR